MVKTVSVQCLTMLWRDLLHLLPSIIQFMSDCVAPLTRPATSFASYHLIKLFSLVGFWILIVWGSLRAASAGALSPSIMKEPALLKTGFGASAGAAQKPKGRLWHQILHP